MRFAVLVSHICLLLVHIAVALPTSPAVDLQSSPSWITYGSTGTISKSSPDYMVHDHVSAQMEHGHYNLATAQRSIQIPDVIPTTMRSGGKKSTFKITVVDQPKTRDVLPAIKLATSVVEHNWESDVPVNMRIAFADLGGGNVLANGGGTHFARMKKVFKEIVPVAAAEAFLGRDLNGHKSGNGQFDVLITINTNTPWYLGIDGKTPTHEYDLATVLLHEIYHNLIFTGGIFVDVSKDKGGRITEEAKVKRDFITRFDSFLATKEGCAILGYLSDTALQKRTGRRGTELLAQAVVNDNLFFGYHAYGVMIRLHAPRLFKAKSSIYHIDPRTGGPDAMMSPVIRPGRSQHQIGPVILNMQRLFLDPEVKGANPNCPRPMADPKPTKYLTAEERTGNRYDPIHDAPSSLDSIYFDVKPRGLSAGAIITLAVLGGLLLLALCIALALVAMGACKKKPKPEGDHYGKEDSYDGMGKGYSDMNGESNETYTNGQSIRPPVVPPTRAPSSCIPIHEDRTEDLCPPPPVCKPRCKPPSSKHSSVRDPSRAPTTVPRSVHPPSNNRHSSCPSSSKNCRDPGCGRHANSHRPNSHRPNSHRPNSQRPNSQRHSSRAPKTHDYFDCA